MSKPHLHVVREDSESFTCPDCGMTSYHPKDIEYQYCGNCHEFKTPRPRPLKRSLRHLWHTWEWNWDPSPPAHHAQRTSSGRRKIVPATGWWSCKCGKVDREASFKPARTFR